MAHQLFQEAKPELVVMGEGQEEATSVGGGGYCPALGTHHPLAVLLLLLPKQVAGGNAHFSLQEIHPPKGEMRKQQRGTRLAQPAGVTGQKVFFTGSQWGHPSDEVQGVKAMQQVGTGQCFYSSLSWVLLIYHVLCLIFCLLPRVTLADSRLQK